MIELVNVEGDIEFKCEVVGYEFPDDMDDWCLLKVSVHQFDNRCELVDPAIEVFELELLHDWFTCLAENRLPKYARLTFTEPCISFEFLAYKDGLVRIAIALSHELKPNFNIKQFRKESSRWNIVFLLNSDDFKRILAGIRGTISMYPSKRGRSDRRSQ